MGLGIINVELLKLTVIQLYNSVICGGDALQIRSLATCSFFY